MKEGKKWGERKRKRLKKLLLDAHYLVGVSEREKEMDRREEGGEEEEEEVEE